jgi:ParB family chromosome partitioning protein
MTVEQVPLAWLVPSPYNPRGKYSRDPEQLKELAADIAVHGVQQAILVRPDGAGKYEIVFGTRRADASKMAGKETIPAVVREMSAEEALTLAMVENLQRADIHFMDEAAGFKKLLSGGVAPKTVAEMVGKPEVYVHLRMALNNLNLKWTAEAYKGTLLLGSALMLARLTPGAQLAAWKEFNRYGMNEDGNFGAAAIGRFLERHVMTLLSKASFPIDSADLVPAAGSCTTCPKRSGASPMLFPDIKETDTCTDAECYGNKCRAFLELRKKELPGALEIASREGLGYSERDQLRKKKVILARQEYEKGG